MAGVSGERGQLLLVTAVAMSVLLILVAVLLSSVVYAENVATRDGKTTQARDARLAETTAIDAVTELLARSNGETRTYDEFYGLVADWEAHAARHAATDGATTRVAIAASTNGTHVVQSDGNRTLTNATGDGSWTLVTDATERHGWQLTVNASSLVAPGTVNTTSDLTNASVFHLAVTDETATWQAFLYRDGADVTLWVVPGTDPVATCTVAPDANGTVTVDFTAETVGGASCSALRYADDVGPAVDIAFENGQNAQGTYTLVVDRPITALDDGDFAGSPALYPYVYDVRIDVTYATPEVTYRVENITITQEAWP